MKIETSFGRIHSTFKSLTDTVDLSADADADADVHSGAGDNAGDNADAGALAIERQSAQASADSDELE